MKKSFFHHKHSKIRQNLCHCSRYQKANCVSRLNLLNHFGILAFKQPTAREPVPLGWLTPQLKLAPCMHSASKRRYTPGLAFCFRTELSTGIVFTLFVYGYPKPTESDNSCPNLRL